MYYILQRLGFVDDGIVLASFIMSASILVLSVSWIWRLFLTVYFISVLYYCVPAVSDPVFLVAGICVDPCNKIEELYNADGTLYRDADDGGG